MAFELESVTVDTGSDDQNGRLVYSGGKLLAILIQLSDIHDGIAGKWHIEAVLGRHHLINTPLFDDPEQACTWISERLMRY